VALVRARTGEQLRRIAVFDAVINNATARVVHSADPAGDTYSSTRVTFNVDPKRRHPAVAMAGQRMTDEAIDVLSALPGRNWKAHSGIGLHELLTTRESPDVSAPGRAAHRPCHRAGEDRPGHPRGRLFSGDLVQALQRAPDALPVAAGTAPPQGQLVVRGPVPLLGDPVHRRRLEQVPQTWPLKCARRAVPAVELDDRVAIL